MSHTEDRSTQPLPKPDPEAIFHHARAIETPHDREAYLDHACEGNPAFRAEISALLAADAGAGSFLATRSAAERPTERDTLDRVGTRVGAFKLLQRIGEGGFGTVYLAEQDKPVRRKVALKIIKPGMDSKQVIGRFEAERQALAIMDHPHIARVLDGGVTTESSGGGRPYFVMEYVVGDAITKFADAHALSLRERLDLFQQVCSAVQHAHTKGIIHRDLKPGNVLVSMVDGKPFAKVIDFGIAKATGAAGGRLSDVSFFTEHRQLIGTPEYMSPEQAEGSLDIDTRTDVYSLGVLLYELLTGTTPIEGERLRSAAFDEMRRMIREDEPLAPSMKLSRSLEKLASTAAARRVEPAKLSALVKGELDWIVLKALEKERARRYETANALADDVRRHLAGEAVVAAPVSRAYRVRKFVRKHRVGVVAGSAVAAALVAGIAGTTWQWRRAEELAQERQSQVERANHGVGQMFSVLSDGELDGPIPPGIRSDGTPETRDPLEYALGMGVQLAESLKEERDRLRTRSERVQRGIGEVLAEQLPGVKRFPNGGFYKTRDGRVAELAWIVETDPDGTRRFVLESPARIVTAYNPRLVFDTSDAAIDIMSSLAVSNIKAAREQSATLERQRDLVTSTLSEMFLDGTRHAGGMNAGLPVIPELRDEPGVTLVPSLKGSGTRDDPDRFEFLKRDPTTGAFQRIDDLQLLPALADSAKATLLKALEVADAAEWNAYRAGMSAGQTSVAAGAFVEARKTLDETPSLRRGWEWHFLRGTAASRYVEFPNGGSSVRALADGSIRTMTTEGVTLTTSLWTVSAHGTPVRTSKSELLGHTDMVQGTDIASDGSIVATCSQDRTAIVWRLDDARLVSKLVLSGHSDTVNNVALSPDSHLVATSSHDGTVRVWDAVTGKERARYDRRAMEIRWSPDSSALVLVPSVFADSVVVWHWKRQDQDRAVVEVAAKQPWAAALNHDGTLLAVAARRGAELQVWRLGDGPASASRQLGALHIGAGVYGGGGAGRCVIDFAFTRRGELVFAGDGVYKWMRPGDVSSTPILIDDARGVFSIALDEDKSAVVLCTTADFGGERELVVVAPLDQAGGPESRLDADVAIPRPSTDGGLSTASHQGSGMLALRIDARVGATPLSGLTITTPDGTRRIVGGNDKTVRFYESKDGKPTLAPTAESPEGVFREVAVFRMHEAVTNLQMTGDGMRLIIHLADGSARVWDIRDPEERRKDLQGEWGERVPAGSYLDKLWACDTPDENLRDAVIADASLTPLRRLVAVEMLEERLEDDRLAAEEAFAGVVKDQTDKAAVQAAASLAELSPRIKARVVAAAAGWAYSVPEDERLERLALADAAIAESRSREEQPEGNESRVRRALADRLAALGRGHVKTAEARAELARIGGMPEDERRIATSEWQYRMSSHEASLTWIEDDKRDPRALALVVLNHESLAKKPELAAHLADEHRQRAREALAKARTLMQPGAATPEHPNGAPSPWANDEDAKALLAEAEALIEGGKP